MINLSVNLNKVALLRNSRGANNPSPRVAAETVAENGAAGLTLHWREDNRHTRESDVRELCALAKDLGVEFNLEGDTREELVELALEIQPTQFTLVPVTPGEITSDHGWDLPRQSELLAPILARVNDAGIRSAIFMDIGADMKPVKEIGAQRVELYTEPYAVAWGSVRQQPELERFRDSARAAHALGIGANAGHDLNLANMPAVAREIPELLEVSIGHALVADALYLGLAEATRRYVAVCRGESVDYPATC
ncbi:MAG: pyridoxine 5'-phosphate synthase [Deltaproteobacteria bacterium]|nr:pyridoxine 5'-phosphate synthase [Deltaproteobacteria bacterium]